MSKGGGGGTTTQVQKADPWAGQQPYLTDVYRQAQQQYQAGFPQTRSEHLVHAQHRT